MSANPRHREWTKWTTNEQECCAACGSSMLSTWARTVRLNGEHLRLCTTCRIELGRSQRALRAFLRCRAMRGDPINDDLLNELQ